VTVDRPPAESLAADALAADGGIVHLRPVRPDDAVALAELHGRGSVDSLRLRFFATPGQTVLEEEVARLVRPATARHDVILAEQGGVVIGVASYERASAADRRAEFAVFVDEAHHGRGIGTLLLEHLAASARRSGVTELVGEVMAGNYRMLRVATDLSGRAWSRFDDGIVDVGLTTAVDDETLAAADSRDRTAERASLRPLFAPRSVAVVGAGREPGGIGHETLRAMVEYGFTGGLFAVNPHADSVAGVAAFPTLTAIGEPVELAVIAVPVEAVPGVIADAGAAGVRAAVILSAGFGEAGATGRDTQVEMVRVARAHGVRLVGPNCLGVLNTDPTVRLAATFAPVLPSSGGLALASQSGAVGVAALDHAARTGTGVSSFVSLGNKADVSGNDLLSYWFDDPATSAVALYLESFGNPRRFARIVRALARRKPVLAVFSGRSIAGQRAGASHTAAAASPGVAVDSLFAQAGVVRADHLGELLDAARMLTDQPLPGGDRIAILGNAGGVNVLAADAAEPAGLRVPQLGPDLRANLGRLVVGGGNPLDLGAGATPWAFADSLDLIAASGEVDAVLIVVAATRANDVTAVLAALAPVADRYSTLPMAVVTLGTYVATTLGHRRAPVFDLPERGISALGRAAGYAAWRREPLGAQPVLTDVDTVGAQATVRAALGRGGGWQSHTRIADILGRYGIPLVPTLTAVGEAAVVREAARLGLPVAVKAADPDIVHKSDVGAVKLNLADANAVLDAYRQIAGALKKPEPAVLVQPMAAPGVEMVAGIVHDPLFGSLVMAGLGGVHTDLFADRAFRLVPMTDQDAGRMWRSLRAAPLLTGYRGSPAANTAALEDLLLRLGRLAEEIPEVAELDLNPIIVGPGGAVVVDAKLRLANVGPEPDAALRVLRQPT
jgi:acyl-CoA synthetase (NDP forming)/RimJ/RimL family protein N-acetyltransferase